MVKLRLCVHYLPHHAVMKEDSIITKLRVVFDGSCKTSSGKSLNDILRVGPIIQSELFAIITRFRQQYVITDIEKNVQTNMYILNIEIFKDLCGRRKSQLKNLFLNSVTFGLLSPLLAVHCLHQLAYNHQAFQPTLFATSS